MQKYGIDVDKLSPFGQAAARAAEQLKSRTVIYRDDVPIAAVVPMSDLDKLDPPDPGEGGDDPLLALCGTFSNDLFVDSLSDLERTSLFLRGSSHSAGSDARAAAAHALPTPSLPARSGATLKPPPMAKPPPVRGRNDG